MSCHSCSLLRLACPILVISHFGLRRPSPPPLPLPPSSLSVALAGPWNFRIAYTSTVQVDVFHIKPCVIRVPFKSPKARDSFKVCKVSADTMISKVFRPRADFFSTVLFVVRLFSKCQQNATVRRRKFRDLVPGERKNFSRMPAESPLARKVSRAKSGDAKTNEFSPRFNFRRIKERKPCRSRNQSNC